MILKVRTWVPPSYLQAEISTNPDYFVTNFAIYQAKDQILTSKVDSQRIKSAHPYSIQFKQSPIPHTPLRFPVSSSKASGGARK